MISYFKEIFHFYAQGKTIMLTLYQNLLENMPRDNNAFMHVSTHKNIHIFTYNAKIHFKLQV